LAGADGHAVADRFDRIQPPTQMWVALRTAWIDARLATYTGDGAGRDQVVILGAGLDARAARLARPGLRFFEVDHPGTQAAKRERIASVAGYPADAATYVACDFEKDDFLERLTAAGFDPGRPAFVTWEGVTPYLPEEAVRATMERLAQGCDERTVLIFDFINKRMAQGSGLTPDDVEVRETVDDLGEPFRFGTNDILPLLAECGFHHVRTASFDEICLSATGTYERARKFRFQHMALASRAEDLS
jgi:methyltransferase (TIGR00027 family)